ncbi:hypothetical protein B7C42_01615 [Nocardia cerradoensis]|uniref:Uncharacterized protein n=1 Tax=Nocardia cerradoensis TaxID=85688 RepID=A0A231HCL0_9NOCA|nr:hypothetical protein [Nocardia cerradoensis]OXR46641.1 hypothetical protein B7C42_01615 [Nocardia cerradoensis]
MSEPVVPLDRPRLGQHEAAVKTEAINARPCTYCGAERRDPCRRPGVDGRLYELVIVHPCRLHEPRPDEGNADA